MKEILDAAGADGKRPAQNDLARNGSRAGTVGQRSSLTPGGSLSRRRGVLLVAAVASLMALMTPGVLAAAPRLAHGNTAPPPPGSEPVTVEELSLPPTAPLSVSPSEYAILGDQA